VNKANPEHPLIVVVDGGEYQYIMDGNHRFANAVKTGKDVKVKELDIEEYNKLFGGAG
jgi:ParB-like chromosome segregation protein Spo0J